MAYLPSGTAIIPADKTDEIINNSTSSSSVTYEDHSTFSPTISITLGGETTKADAEEIVRRVKQAMEDLSTTNTRTAGTATRRPRCPEEGKNGKHYCSGIGSSNRRFVL